MQTIGYGVVLALAAALIGLSPRVMAAAGGAAAVFVRSVMPALFPLMVLNGVSAEMGFQKPKSRTFALGFTVALAFVSGSPAAAQRLMIAREENGFTPAEWSGLTAAAGVMSPLFIAGSLAAQTGYGLRLLAAHWLSALMTGGLCGLAAWLKAGKRAGRAKGESKGGKSPSAREAASRVQASAAAGPKPNVPFTALLPRAIAAAAQSLLAVCGAMMLFSVAAAVISAAAAAAFPRWAAANAGALAVLWALMEVGGGAFAVLAAFPSPPLPLLCALCGFGGLSIWLQNLLFFGQSVSPAKLLLTRALHGALAYLIGWALLLI